MLELLIEDRQSELELSDDMRDSLIEVAELVIDLEGVGECDCEVSLSLVNSEDIKKLNRIHRNKDSYTDVLSFPQYEMLKDMDEVDEELALGDIIINTDYVLSQAREYGHPVERELLYLFTHSMFHLFGYDHMEAKEKDEMRQREEYVLESVGMIRKN